MNLTILFLCSLVLVPVTASELVWVLLLSEWRCALWSTTLILSLWTVNWSSYPKVSLSPTRITFG